MQPDGHPLMSCSKVAPRAHSEWLLSDSAQRPLTRVWMGHAPDGSDPHPVLATVRYSPSQCVSLQVVYTVSAIHISSLYVTAVCLRPSMGHGTDGTDGTDGT